MRRIKTLNVGESGDEKYAGRQAGKRGLEFQRITGPNFCESNSATSVPR